MTTRSTLNRLAAGCLGALLCAHAGQSFATEGGGSSYPAGVETFVAGAVPPPGFYTLLYGEAYKATKLYDGNGQRVPISDFKVDATAVVPRFVWSTATPLLSGTLVYQLLLPVANVSVRAGGASQTRTGVGDVSVGTAIAWHHSPSLHAAGGFNVFVPTGSYDKTNLANLGRNYWVFQPTYAVSVIDPAGLNADLKLTVNFNGRNSATDYRSGTEFFAEYALGWGLGGGWTAGASGYVVTQLTNDRQKGASVAASKSQVLALGPAIKYDGGKGFFVTAKLQFESQAKNRSEGSAFWVKAVLPF